MLVTYEVVHIRKDKSEQLVATVKNKDELPRITESTEWIGTWIRENRKILRWGKGEIHIRMKEYPMTVNSFRVVYIGTMPLYELEILYGKELTRICLNKHTFVGYDTRMVPLWQTSSLTMLADIVGKELAYEVQFHQDRYIEEYDNLAQAN